MTVLSAAGCAFSNPHYDANKPHHRPEGFQNVDPAAFMPVPLAQFLRWQRERLSLDIAPPKMDLSVVPAELDALRTNRSRFAVTWIGHASALVQLGGINVLTDPIFSERASPVQWAGPKRWQPPGIALKDLPHIDVVVISHNHYDHLDLQSVHDLNTQPGGPPLFVVPLGTERWMADVGIANVKALDWWQSVEVRGASGAATVHLTPLQHWTRRTLADTMQCLWGGYVVETGEGSARRSFFFGGDTGYSAEHFPEIGRRFASRGGIDLGVIPIGGYEPRWFMSRQHVNPEEAVKIHRDIGTRRSLGVHWGTFQLTDEPLDQAVSDLAAARIKFAMNDGEFFVLRHGQTRWFD
jgi:L-ascorbate metabolism protein UlaG (beta-lactamase superfamily)